jgi:hypothetical protein
MFVKSRCVGKTKAELSSGELIEVGYDNIVRKFGG